MTEREAKHVLTLIADGGSTKCQWILTDGTMRREFITPGVNPAIAELDAIAEAIGDSAMWDEIAKIAENGIKLRSVRYYGAGCIGGQANEKMSDAIGSLCRCDDITIASDMLGAAHAALGERKGVVCILGTGANSCSYDGEKITRNVRPLGYILGDEGSGADIGKHIVADALKGIWPDDLTNSFYEFAGADYSAIIANIYSRPRANAYLAGFAKFAAQNIGRDEIRNIVSARIEAFLRRNVLFYDEEDVANGVSFVGGVAWEFSDIVREVCSSNGVNVSTIIRRPIEGMVDYALRH